MITFCRAKPKGQLEQLMYDQGIKKISSGKLVNPIKLEKQFIYVGADWCGICYLKAYELSDYKKRYKQIRFSFLDLKDSMDVRNLEKVTGKYGAVPAYIVLNQNDKPLVLIGYSERNKARLLTVLDSLSR